MERNLPGCPFRFERNPDGTPVFEDFAKRNVKVGDYYLYGTCDGILHTAKNKSGGGGTEACERIDGRRTASNSRDEPYAKGTGTPWDKAAQYHADKAKEAAEVGDKQATPFYSISHNGALLAVSIQGKEVAFN